MTAYAVKKTAKCEQKDKELKLILSKWKFIIYIFVAIFTVSTSYEQTNLNLIFLNVIIVTVSTLEAISNNREYKELNKELYNENSKVIEKYSRKFDEIVTQKKHEEYMHVRENIKRKCNENKNYESPEYINLELERVEENIETIKSPSSSYLFAILGMFMPTIVTIWTASISKENNPIYINIVLEIVSVYVVVVSLVFIYKIRDNNKKIQVLIVYKSILKELKILNMIKGRKSIMENSRPLLTEVYNKMKEHGKVDKIRWFRDCNVNIELSKLNIDNIKATSKEGYVFGIAFSINNGCSKSWIQIFNTDMTEIIFSKEDDDESADIVIKMNDNSNIKIWFDFAFA